MALPLLDPGLKAQAKATEVLALLALGEEEAAWQKLVEAKQSGLPEPFRLQLGRAVGRAHPGLAARLPPTPLAPPRPWASTWPIPTKSLDFLGARGYTACCKRVAIRPV